MLKTITVYDKNIFGVASLVKECPKGKYRYNISVKAKAVFPDKHHDDLFIVDL